MLLIEAGLTLAAIMLAFVRPEMAARWIAPIEEAFERLAGNPRRAVMVVAVAALLTRAALLQVLPVPEPIVHDEFGYLLAGDTFAHGRVTNPTHPLWVHFETFSTLMRPSYQCYGPPAQGAVLAVGRLLGNPFWGVMLSAAIMCGAMVWMLQGWLPPGWALLAGVLAILRIGTLSYWANSYWGGAAGAIGGALALGALPRIRRAQRPRDAVLMAAGLAILANSRPYEGAILSVPVAIGLLAWMVGRNAPQLSLCVRKVVTPIVLVMALALATMGYYYWRVTGSPFRMAYQVEQETYGMAPYMIWQRPRPEPVYHHEIIRRMYLDQLPEAYQLARTCGGVLGKAVWMWLFFLGPALTLPFFMMLFVLPYGFGWRDLSCGTRFLIVTFVVYSGALLLEVFFNPHYAAPITGLLLALVLAAMRKLCRWKWREKPVGLFLTRAVPVICVIMFMLRIVAEPLHIKLLESYAPAWYQRGPAGFGRAQIVAELARMPGRQLVIVRYQPSHQPFDEWVYNEPDIDAAKVVWARDMGASRNQELIDYFKDRQVWLLDADQWPRYLSSPNRFVDRAGNAR